MNANFGLLFVLLAVTLAASALGHDPLRESHDKSGRHGLTHLEEKAEKPDLTAVRSLALAFRETGDDRFLDEAWNILGPALDASRDDPETLVAGAFVAQSRHEFTYALQLIRKALSINVRNDEGWLLLASIQLVRGNAKQSAEACAQLRDVSPLIVLTCKARVAVASGDHDMALMRLRGVLGAVDTTQMPAHMLAWVYGVVGDLSVAAGNSRLALEFYRQSLVLSERTQVRAALVDVLLEIGEDRLASQALDHGAAALPLLVRRFIVAKRLNRVGELRAEIDKVEREFNIWISREDWLHAREMTRFFIDVIDRPALARRLAVINYGLQREPEDLILEKRTRRSATSKAESS